MPKHFCLTEEVAPTSITVPVYNNTRTPAGYLHSCVSVGSEGVNCTEWIERFHPVLRSMKDA